MKFERCSAATNTRLFLKPLLTLGGIFLATKNRHSSISSNPHRLFCSAPSGLSTKAACALANRRFLHTHDKLALQKLVDIRHFIIYLNGQLHLLQQSNSGGYEQLAKQDSPALGDDYILYKTLIHKVTELLMTSHAMLDGNIAWENRQQYFDDIDEDLGIIATSLNKNETLEYDLHLDLIRRAKDLIAQAKETSNLKPIDLLCQRYLQDMQPIMNDYGKKATKIQLEGMHITLSNWYSQYQMDLQTSRSLVVGGKGARKDMIEMQMLEDCYLKEGINDAKKKDYVWYVESPLQLMSSIKTDDLIHTYGKHLLNRKIGLSILGNADAMSEDVLGKFATEILQVFPPISKRGIGSYGVEPSGEEPETLAFNLI